MANFYEFTTVGENQEKVMLNVEFIEEIKRLTDEVTKVRTVSGKEYDIYHMQLMIAFDDVKRMDEEDSDRIRYRVQSEEVPEVKEEAVAE